jgi:hypothetical protein
MSFEFAMEFCSAFQPFLHDLNLDADTSAFGRNGTNRQPLPKTVHRSQD